MRSDGVPVYPVPTVVASASARSTGAWVRAAARGMVASVCSALIATLLVALALTALGKDPLAVLSVLIRGPLGDRYGMIESLARSTPLILCGLAVALAFRAQAWNIGVEGQYLAGAMAATAVGTAGSGWPGYVLVPVLLAGAAAAGGLWAVPAIALDHRRGVPLVLSTILLNFVALHLVQYLTRGPLQGPDVSAPESALIAGQGHLPLLVPGTDLHGGFILAIAAALAGAIVLHWGTAGFALRAAGLNPVAAEWAGIRIRRVKFRVMCLSGALGGLAGGMQVAGVHHLLRDDAAEGFGYVAIAAALLGRLNPLGVAVAAVALGALDIGALRLERQSRLGIPADLAQVIKGILILTLLVTAGLRTRFPRASTGRRLGVGRGGSGPRPQQTLNSEPQNRQSALPNPRPPTNNPQPTTINDQRPTSPEARSPFNHDEYSR